MGECFDTEKKCEPGNSAGLELRSLWQVANSVLTCADIFSHTLGKQYIGGNLKMCWVALSWFYCMIDWFYVHLIILGRNVCISLRTAL